MGWEYHNVAFNFDAAAFISLGGLFDSEQFTFEMNRLGWDGWELISVFDTNQTNGSTRNVVAVFKRPLTPERRNQLLQAAGK